MPPPSQSIPEVTLDLFYLTTMIHAIANCLLSCPHSGNLSPVAPYYYRHTVGEDPNPHAQMYREETLIGEGMSEDVTSSRYGYLWVGHLSKRGSILIRCEIA